MGFETYYEFYQKDLEDANKKKDYSKLKLLTAKRIVDKMVRCDKNFSNARIVGVDWARRDLSNFDFSGSKIEWCVFSGCKIKGANFSEAFLDWCIFENTDLTKTNFKKSIIYDSIFPNSDLTDVDFSNSDLRWILFSNIIGIPNFTNCTQIGIFHSLEEVSRRLEEAGGVELVKFFIQKAGLPLPQSLTFKIKFNELKSAGEKLRLFYDTGREAFDSSGNLNLYKSKQVGKTGVGEYHPEDSTYTSRHEYGIRSEYGVKKKDKGVL